MIHLPVRPGTAWARPLFVALIVLSLAASASIALAAPATESSVSPVLPPAAIAVQVAGSTSGASAPTPVSQFPTLSSGMSTTTAPTVRSLPSIAPALPVIVRPRVVVKAMTVATPSAPKPAVKTTTATSTTPHYVGVYHLWIPALGLSRGISDWGCRGGLIPNRVEYWGCAGKNNLYLLGHASGVFASIHDGYHTGALRVGLTAYYADKAGKTHRYRISQIRHVTNASYATWSRWAMAASTGPVITLQTCDGPTSAYRILVRLVPA